MARQQNKQIPHHLHWKKDIAVGLALLFGVLSFSAVTITTHSWQLFGRYVSSVSTHDKVVALTFDDGPTNKHIDEVLTTLDEYDVKATFFLIGKEIALHPGAGKKIVQAGHEIGNHSYTHRSLVFVPYSTISKEIESTDSEIRKIGYSREISFRPPYGHKFIGLPWYLQSHGRLTVLWNIAPDDHFKTAEDMTRDIEKSVTPGSIIVLHVMEDHRVEQRKALKQFIPALQSQGYTFVTVSELLNHH